MMVECIYKKNVFRIQTGVFAHFSCFTIYLVLMESAQDLMNKSLDY